MIYRIEIKAGAVEALARIARRDQVRIGRAIDGLSHQPRPPRARKLAGVQDAWRIRVGDYRIVYQIHESVLTVVVIRVGHRKDVYRNL